jgi:glutathionyl-hydroquinone reductase
LKINKEASPQHFKGKCNRNSSKALGEVAAFLISLFANWVVGTCLAVDGRHIKKIYKIKINKHDHEKNTNHRK